MGEIGREIERKRVWREIEREHGESMGFSYL